MRSMQNHFVHRCILSYIIGTRHEIMTSLFYKMTFPGRHKNKFMHWEKTSRESASVLLI